MRISPSLVRTVMPYKSWLNPLKFKTWREKPWKKHTAIMMRWFYSRFLLI